MSRHALRGWWPCALLPAVFTLATSAHAQNWPQFYDPNTVLTINLTMASQDWDAIRHDNTFTIVRPGYLSLPGETPLLVGIRRKSSIAFPSEADPMKVGLKVDINEYVEQSWHALKKLSLENGSENGALHEGFAWYLHRLAWGPSGYPYMPGLAAWVQVYMNGTYLGCYVNAEQTDKRFLENRGLWLSDDSWLYKADSETGSHTLEFGSLAGSPLYTELCYSPFPTRTCPTPAPATLATDLPARINMQGMLTLGAVNAWCYSPDNLFSKGKNYYYADFRYGLRHYYSWDMDANFGSLNTTRSIYELGNSAFEDLILDNPTFRTQYDDIMRDLLNGPFSTSSLIAAVDALEPVIGPVLSGDPYQALGAEAFDDLRDYITDRNLNVASQLPPSVGVGDGSAPAAIRLALGPNPFRVQTRIEFDLAREGQVRVDVHDTRGARVASLAEGPYPAGRHQLQWRGTDQRGGALAAGLYFVRFETGGQTRTESVVLLR